MKSRLQPPHSNTGPPADWTKQREGMASQAILLVLHRWGRRHWLPCRREAVEKHICPELLLHSKEVRVVVLQDIDARFRARCSRRCRWLGASRRSERGMTFLRGCYSEWPHSRALKFLCSAFFQLLSECSSTRVRLGRRLFRGLLHALPRWLDSREGSLLAVRSLPRM